MFRCGSGGERSTEDAAGGQRDTRRTARWCAQEPRGREARGELVGGAVAHGSVRHSASIPPRAETSGPGMVGHSSPSTLIFTITRLRRGRDRVGRAVRALRVRLDGDLVLREPVRRTEARPRDAPIMWSSTTSASDAEPRRRPRRSARRRHRLTQLEVLRTRRGRADLAIFHELAPSPSGGGHQFVRALVRELDGRGLDGRADRISGQTPACLFNSFNFDLARLRRFAERGARMVHRVDGPIGVYRGFDDGTDAWIATVNAELASATIFQSRFSLEKHRELGLELRDPVVIPNAVDPAIFHPPPSREPLEGRKVRLVATSWSDNPRKGGETLAWLDRNLDHARFELTFAGRAPATFERVHVVGPLDSHALAALLRTQDAYLAPSRDDPCSNALLEALACGLPAASIATAAGIPSSSARGACPFGKTTSSATCSTGSSSSSTGGGPSISTRPIAWVADRYLEVLGLCGAP